MAQDNRINMPGAFGGLMRYDAEYQSKFMIKPSMVIAFIIFVIVLAIAFRIFLPVGVA